MQRSGEPVSDGSVLDAAPDAVITIDSQGAVVEINRAAERIFGHRAEDMLGRPIANLIVPEHLRAAHVEGLRRAAAGEPPRILGRRLRMPARHADGREIPVELTVTRTSQSPPRFTAWIRDLTERLNAEAKLARHTALLESAEQLAEMGSWEWNLDSDELLWSDNLFRLFGFEPQETTPTLGFLFESVHPADREQFQRGVAIAKQTGLMPPLEFRILRPDRSVRHLRATSTTTTGPDTGLRRRVIGSTEDLTERRRAEREIAARCAVSEALGEWESLDRGGERLLRSFAEALGCEVGALWLPRDNLLINQIFWPRRSSEFSELEEAMARLRFPRGSGLVGRTWQALEPVHVPDVSLNGDIQYRGAASAAGLHGAFAVPALHGDEVLAVLEFYSREEAAPTERLIRSLTGISYELGQFLARRRGELAPPSLTPRELEVLQHAAHGFTGRRIAEQLVISPATVKTHFENVYAKLGVSDRAAAVAHVLRRGLIE